MTTIRSLFSRKVDRSIEPVVNYATATQRDEALQAEVSEYVTTAAIEESADRLLRGIEDIAEGKPNSEAGIWVSGFYGSGKSSFTKYLGMALDADRQLNGRPFREALAEQLAPTAPVRQLLRTVGQKYPATVIMLDLASEASNAMKLVQAELYRKVLQWAGFSTEPRTRDLELRLSRDGKYEEFQRLVEAKAKAPWRELSNDPYQGIQYAAEFAHHFYPSIFATPDTLYTLPELTQERGGEEDIAEMLRIVRQKSGRELVIFVVDEVGQYVASNDDRIRGLQGLAEALKNQGQALLIATAQQTLTNDNPDAALNSAKLNKLLARFPMQLELKASDIRFIITSRLLGKSGAGAATLHKLHEQHGQALRHATSLHDVPAYYKLSQALDREAFVDLYPFLPAHFDLMLRLLSGLSTKHGGMGLRSVLKLTQDMLLDSRDATAVADAPTGRLITLLDFYRVLKLEIERTASHLTEAVEKARSAFGTTSLEAEGAAAVAVLQLLDDFPATPANVAALLQADAARLRPAAEIEKALARLDERPELPFKMQDGRLVILSDLARNLEEIRLGKQPNIGEMQQLEHEIVSELLPDPLRRVTVFGGTPGTTARAVTAGLDWQGGAPPPSTVKSGADPVQVVVALYDAGTYDTELTALRPRTTAPTETARLWLCGRVPTDWRPLLIDLFRAREMVRLYPTPEPGEQAQYIRNQGSQARRTAEKLRDRLRKALEAGSVVHRGDLFATAALAATLPGALSSKLREAAEFLYPKYALAPVPAATSTAATFLRANDLTALPPDADPLRLADPQGGIRHDHPALRELSDFLTARGQLDGRPLLDHFDAAPYGWTKDVTRYLVAALVRDGRARLLSGGQALSATSREAIDALANTASFGRVALRPVTDAPSAELRTRAANRLEELSTRDVSPTAAAIGRVAREWLPDQLTTLANLPSQLRGLDVPGADRAAALVIRLGEVQRADDTELIAWLGDPNGTLFDDLRWAGRLRQELTGPLADTLQALRPLRDSLTPSGPAALPGLETPFFDGLRRAAATTLDLVADWLATDGFGRYTRELSSALQTLMAAVATAAPAVAKSYLDRLTQQTHDLRGHRNWDALDNADAADIDDQLTALAAPFESAAEVTTATLAELRTILNQWAAARETLDDIRDRLNQHVREDSGDYKPAPLPSPGQPIRLRRQLRTVADLDVLLARLQTLRPPLAAGQTVDLDFEE